VGLGGLPGPGVANELKVSDWVTAGEGVALDGIESQNTPRVTQY
jgi:hypothetical protein